MLSPYLWFVNNTCTIWDYKTEARFVCPYEWFNDMYITHVDNKHRTTEWIYFDGILISADDIGNLNLGYVGSKMGYDGFLLLNPTTEDSKHDSDIIRYGSVLAGRG